MISFGIKYWFIFLILLLATAAGIVFLLYVRNKESRELTSKQRWFLMLLRFFSFALVAFLLLSPFVRNLRRIVQNPVIIAAWDNSGSMVATGDSIRMASEITGLKERISKELSSGYTLVNYSFGQETNQTEELNFSEKKSDYSNLITTITNNHFNENVGALLLAGDGIYNQGRNPVNMIDNLTFPVYTIGFGDTTEVTDARIQGVRVNRTSFANNQFPVEIDTRFFKLKRRSLKLTVREEGSVVAETVITPPNDDYFSTYQFILEAGEPGLKHFSVDVEVFENERNIKNNQSNFMVNVLENKQKILILSDGSHPDIGAIKNTLEQQKSYEVSVFTGEPYPSNLEDFNLVILNQLPSSGKSMAGIFEDDASRRIPLLFIVGGKTFLPQFNTLSTGVSIEPLASSSDEAQAFVNPGYATFTLSESFRELAPKFPPIMIPFAKYTLTTGFTPLLYQKVKNIETGKPLMATGVLNGRKTGFIFGEGIWRWRLNNWFQNQSHGQFNELVNQLIQYLALRHNEDNFMIDFEPVYDEIDDVVMNAEVYNDAFERITTDEVTIVIANDEGNEFEFTFDVRSDEYYLNAGNLPVGNYYFEAGVTIGDQTFTETGNFAVASVHLEDVVSRANHHILYQLASQTGGEFYLPDDAAEIISALNNSNKMKPTTYFQEMVSELLNQRWLFFVLLLLLSVEWFLRKYWGIY